MKGSKRVLTFLVLCFICALPSTVFAARWQLGSANFVDPNQYGTTEQLTIGDGDNRTWYWSEGWGILFSPNHQMPMDQDSSELSCGKNAGGRSFFAFTFHFSKPISKFRFTTPLFSSLNLSEGDIIVQYAAGEKGEYKELFRYGKNSKGYTQGGELKPVQLDWVKFDSPEKWLRIRFVLEGFVGKIPFHAGKDDGGVLEYTTTVLAPEKMVSVKLLPDKSLQANLYLIDEPIRAIIDIGPTKLASVPELQLYDEQRHKIAKTVSTEPMGRLYRADVMNLPAGCYELRVLLPLQEGTKEVPSGKIILLHSPRALTRDQERKSPFGMNDGISYVGGADFGSGKMSKAVDGPNIAKLIGVHQMRTGTPTWLTACQEQGVYNIPSRDALTAQVEELMKFGLVWRNNLAWTPGWALDMERIKREGNIGTFNYPCKEEYLKDFAEYCRRLAQTTTGLIEPEFEIWNEPNNEPYGSFKGTFDEFVTRCDVAADAVHSVNPKARMILGSTGGADVGYIARCFKAGLSKKYAIVDVHPYRQSEYGPEDGLLLDIRRLQKAILQHGDNQAIIFSEIGWQTSLPTGQHKGGYVSASPTQQAWYTSRTMIVSIAAGVERVHFHMLRDWGGKATEPEYNFGFVTFDAQPKPALSALAATSRHLEATKFLGVVKNTPEFHHQWAWQTPWQENAALLTIWADTAMLKDGKPQWIYLPAKPILAEDLWGGPVGPDRLQETKDGWRILPGEDPMFVYIPAQSLQKELASLPESLRPINIQHTKARRLNGTSKSPCIDGDLSEWGMLSGTIADRGGRSSGGSMGYAGIEEKFKLGQTGSAKFDVAYDDKGIYFATQVKDPDGFNNDKSHWWIWAGDCVRFYMSTKNTTEVPYYTDDHFQFIASPESTNHGPAQVAHISFATPRGVKSGDLIPGSQVKAKPAEGGWSIEVFIPWNYFGKTPKPGDVWSFDIEAGGNPWNGGETNWNNPAVWGRLEFDK